MKETITGEELMSFVNAAQKPAIAEPAAAEAPKEESKVEE